MILRAAVIWLVLMLAAIGNGAFRTVAIAAYMSDTAAHVVSTILLCVLILLLAYLAIAWIGPRSVRDAVVVGVLWCALTLAFEFLAGHFLFRNSWDRLLADYDLAAGRVWVFVPIVCAAAPLWAARQRRLLGDQS